MTEITDRRYQQRLEADRQGVTYPSGIDIPDPYVTPTETPPNTDGAAGGRGDTDPIPQSHPATVETIEFTYTETPPGIDPYGHPIDDFAA